MDPNSNSLAKFITPLPGPAGAALAKRHEKPYEMPEIMGLLNTTEELEIIGAACNSVTFAEEVAGMVAEQEIWDPRNRILYVAVSFLAKDTIEQLTPKEIAYTANKIASNSGQRFRYTVEEIEALPKDVKTAKNKVRLLKNNAAHRELSIVGEWLLRELPHSTDAQSLARELVDRVESFQPRTVTDSVKTGDQLGDLMMMAVNARILAAQENKPIPYYPWASWNRILRPPAPGKAHFIGAPDNLGKSAYARWICMYWAKQGFHAVFVHNEDTRDEILLKILCTESRVELDVIKGGKYTPDEWARIQSAQERMAEWLPRFHMIDAIEMNSIDVILELRGLIKKEMCNICMIDWLGAFNPTRGQAASPGDWMQVVDDTRRFVRFSGKFGVPITSMAQGTKEMLDANIILGRRLLAGGAKSYQSAQDIVLFTRDKLTEPIKSRSGDVLFKIGEYSPETKVVVDKQNDGPAGMFTQYFEGKYYTIHDHQFYRDV
jgi:replicative DNA helicase